ncbi:hypothetical protein COOONC_01978 [Cooperia oncophora]
MFPEKVFKLAALTLQIPQYSSEPPARPDRAASRSSILEDTVSSQTYNPMFGAEKLFAGLPRPQAITSQNNITYSCNSPSATGIIPSRYNRAEDTLPLLLAGGGNVFLKRKNDCTSLV